MKQLWIGLIAALLLVPPLSAKPPAAAPTPVRAPDNALVEGQIIDSADNVTIGGWRKLWKADYAVRTHAGRVTTEAEQCCVSVFGKGNALLVIKSEAASRDAKGDPLTERIQRKLWVTKRPGEVIADCQIFWINTQLSLVDDKTDAVRSVVVEDGELVLLNWRGSGSHCAFGDE